MSFFRHSDGAAHEFFSSFRTRNAEESCGNGQSAESEGIPRSAAPHTAEALPHFGMTAGRRTLCPLSPAPPGNEKGGSSMQRAGAWQDGAARHNMG